MAHTPQMHDSVTCIFLPDSSIATSLASGEWWSSKGSSGDRQVMVFIISDLMHSTMHQEPIVMGSCMH